MELSDFIGKTIKSVDESSVNMRKIIFTDGSCCTIFAEIGMLVPYFHIEETESCLKE